MQSYLFTYYLSGKDLRGKVIADHATYHLSFRASTQAIAEKKLRAHYYKSVKVNIQSVSVSQ